MDRRSGPRGAHGPRRLQRKPVLAHTDLSAANVRASEDCITAIYDMDSIALVDEMRLLAGMAVHFTYTGADDGWDWPTREEGRALVADYERARGRSRIGASASGWTRLRSTPWPTPPVASTRSWSPVTPCGRTSVIAPRGTQSGIPELANGTSMSRCIWLSGRGVRDPLGQQPAARGVKES